jgi:hypothetical protein
MAYTDFIAAIDLGSSHMVGMVGRARRELSRLLPTKLRTPLPVYEEDVYIMWKKQLIRSND